MKALVLVGLLLLSCAAAPAPKAPDITHRIPVNRVPPPGVATDETPDKAARKAPKEPQSVEWR